MSHIKYNFDLSRSVSNNLEEISSRLEKNILADEMEYLLLLSDAWLSEYSEKYVEKFKIFMDNISEIRNEIDSESEQIATISRQMYLLEREVERIAREKQQ